MILCSIHGYEYMVETNLGIMCFMCACQFQPKDTGELKPITNIYDSYFQAQSYTGKNTADR